LPPGLEQTVTTVGLLAALALLVLVLRRPIKAAQQRWHRGRARVLLVGGTGSTRMIVEELARADPMVELRLLAAAPVTTLRMAA